MSESVPSSDASSPSDSSESEGRGGFAGARKRKRRRKVAVEISDRDFVSQAGKYSKGFERVTTGRIRNKVKYDDERSDAEFNDLITISNDDKPKTSFFFISCDLGGDKHIRSISKDSFLWLLTFLHLTLWGENEP